MVQWLRKGGREEVRRREGESEKDGAKQRETMLWACDKASPTVAHIYCMLSRNIHWESSTVVQRVKSQAESLCVCKREVYVWQADSVTLYITSLLFPDTHTHQRGGVGAVQLVQTESKAAPPPSTSLILTPLAYIFSLPPIAFLKSFLHILSL